MEITSPAFKSGGFIPKKHSCEGEDISPELKITGVPISAKSLVLICDDPDAPNGDWVHWIMWNIDPEIGAIPERYTSKKSVTGQNSWQKNTYGGPCPPSGVHRYFFKLYALKEKIELDKKSNKQDLLKAIEGKVIERTSLMGFYKKIS